MPTPVIQRTFAGGELAPALHSRADQAKYATGLRTCRNFMVQRHGGVANRAGFRYVDSLKTTSETVRLIPFIPSSGSGIVIEAGVGYFRFYRDGAMILVSGVSAWSAVTNYIAGDIVSAAGVNYYATAASLNQAPPDPSYWYAMPAGNILEVPSPYGTAGRLPNYNQSGNILTLTHPGEAPRELEYFSATRWVLRSVQIGAAVDAPANLAGTAGAAGTRDYAYIVTAAAPDTYEESNPSTPYTIASCAEPTPDAPNELTWDAIAGVPEYHVYLDPFGNGTFGFIGTATGIASFRDTGITPDFGSTPPVPRVLFSADYPSYSAVYQQRRFFANTPDEPDSVYGSKIGFPSNFGISSPLQDDDAITFRVAGNNNHPVRGLVGLKTGLVVLTGGGEWTVRGGTEGGALTPASIVPEQETYVGIAEVAPVAIGNAILYVQARGSVLRDLQFDQQVEGLAGRDLTLWAAHLFEDLTLDRLAYQQTPHSIVWAVRSDGILLGLTYIPEEDVWGWHWHTTQASGAFEDIVVVPESTEDVLYAIVKRTIGGATVRYLERLETRAITAATFNARCFFVDSGLSYSGAPANHFTGLDHLEGEVVAVVGDGTVVYDGDPDGANAALYTVTGGAITLESEYRDAHFGLAIRYADVETLDLDAEGTAVRDRKKRVQGVSVLIERSSRGFLAGPSSSSLRRYEAPHFASTDKAFTGRVELPLQAEYNHEGRVLIRQTDPLPLTILAIIPNPELGG